MIIEHMTARGHEAVYPTARMLAHWWRKLNAELFDKALRPCQLATPAFTVEYSDAQALCWPLEHGIVRIELDAAREYTRSSMLASLAHEMVHQWQHQNGLPTNHGQEFQGWVDRIETKLGVRV
jgi:hypothetical protein